MALLSADVHWVAVCIDKHGLRAAVATKLRRNSWRNHSAALLKPCDLGITVGAVGATRMVRSGGCAGRVREVPLVIHYLHELDASLSHPKHGFGSCNRTGAQHIDEQVVGELMVCARIVLQRLRSGLLGGSNETRAAAARAKRAVDDRAHPLGRLVIEHKLSVGQPVGVNPEPKRTPFVSRQEALFGALGVEQIAHRAGLLRKFFDR